MNQNFIIRQMCPGCRSSEYDLLYSRAYLENPLKDYLQAFYASVGRIEMEYLDGARFILKQCRRCGLVFQQEIPNETIQHLLYEKWIAPDLCLERFHKQADLNFYLHYLQEIMVVIRFFKTLPGNLEVLDFGMGWGTWCQAAKALGCKVRGMEISRAQTEHAQANGIQTIEWESLSGHRFDFINSDQVFEHLDNPLTTLMALKGALKEGGIIKISVPDGSDVKRRLKKDNWMAEKGSRDSLNLVSPLEHINCFNRSALIFMADIAGLEKITLPLHLQYACIMIRSPLTVMLKSLLMPVYRDILGRGVYLFFRPKGTM